MPETVSPEPQHRWLQRLVGEWRWESDTPGADGQSPTRYTGTESVRMLGGLWMIAEGRGDMPDGDPHLTVLTLGYDPARRRFSGTFIGSMMTDLWIYDGELDADERILTLDTEGPSFTEPGTRVRYKDSIELVSDDHRVLTSRVDDGRGGWTDFVTQHFHRLR